MGIFKFLTLKKHERFTKLKYFYFTMQSQKSYLIKEEASNPNQNVNVFVVQEEEAPAANIFKLLFLVLLTYGLIVSMWEVCQAIYHMRNNSVTQSYVDSGGLLFGMFCFYVLCFGVAWCWGSSKREEIKLRVVEEQIAKQRAMEALANIN